MLVYSRQSNKINLLKYVSLILQNPFYNSPNCHNFLESRIFSNQMIGRIDIKVCQSVYSTFLILIKGFRNDSKGISFFCMKCIKFVFDLKEKLMNGLVNWFSL